MIPRTLLTVDPGLHSVGWAIWPQGGKPNRPPEAAGLIHPSKSVEDSDFLVRACDIGDQLLQIAFNHHVAEAWTEWPVFYANSAGGHMAAATGDLLKICAAAAGIAGRLSNQCPTHPVLVPDWKGQLPKPIVITRIKRILGAGVCVKLKLKADMWDAVGIGLYLQGRFK